MPGKKKNRDVRDLTFDAVVGRDAYLERVRIREELAARRSKPNPQARPAADGSPALAALRASLRTAKGAERAKIEAMIAHTERLYKPPTVPAGRRSAVRAIHTGNRTPPKRGAKYHGQPCFICGGTIRYRVSALCVACQLKRVAARRKQERRAAA